VGFRYRAVENLVMTPGFWRGRRVFLTGHTGFKGSWLALWLSELGAEVTGFALPPATTPNLFSVAGVENTLDSVLGDLRDAGHLRVALARAQPEILFHLAAQALVAEGYADPVGTYATNVMGAVHLLEAARQPNVMEKLKVIVFVTSDKCYENVESCTAYAESAPLGGYDPYSSSKACAEILAASWRRSFFNAPEAPRIATARAGNVIGGGDWAAHRLVPDLLAALAAGETPCLRHPESVRPWQHVLEPLAGYLTLAEQCITHREWASAWNFGPDAADCVSVARLAELLCQLWPEPRRYAVQPSALPHEAGLLYLDASRARRHLGWRPRWRLEEALRETVAWHCAWRNGADMNAQCRQQIQRYSAS
jgi:CDP-glucose 4,6-dehydratase